MSHSSRILDFFRKILRQSEAGIVLYRSNNPILCNYLLEALRENKITAYLSQESVGQHIYPVNIGKLAETEIIVAKKEYSQAKALLDMLLAQLEEDTLEQPLEGEDESTPS
ncbi:MAG: hypothetical protein Kow0088_11650 [Anaerolineales bacterium]